MILLPENYFLIILGVIWIIGAVLQDLHRREVDNLWNFSLIFFALGYRLFYSIFSGNSQYILYGLFGVLLSVILGNLFYYMRLYAGGDAKLFIALGSILPLGSSILSDLEIFGIFIILFMVTGSIYALIWAVVVMIINRKKAIEEIYFQTKSNKLLFLISFVLALVWILVMVLVGQGGLLSISFVFLLFPVLYVFSKSIEEACMVKSVSPDKVTVGDWLYKDIVVRGRKIKADWDGVSEKNLKYIQKHCKRKIKVKYGIPFTPSFLFAMIGILILSKYYGWF